MQLGHGTCSTVQRCTHHGFLCDISCMVLVLFRCRTLLYPQFRARCTSSRPPSRLTRTSTVPKQRGHENSQILLLSQCMAVISLQHRDGEDAVQCRAYRPCPIYHGSAGNLAAAEACVTELTRCISSHAAAVGEVHRDEASRSGTRVLQDI